MMSIIISIAGILLTILFVVGTHEAAHFLIAKLLGVKVLRFSIGFGKPLISWHDKSGTEYVIAPIPLGGYVRMLDETEANVPQEEIPFAYNRQPYYKKFLIVVAGPTCNLLCALLLYWIIFMVGFVTIKPIIGSITPHSIAATAGLKPQQTILQVDNKEIATWSGILFQLLTHTGNQDKLHLQVLDVDGKNTQDILLDLTHWRMEELNPDPLTSLGITPLEPEVPLVIGAIAEKSPAANSPLKIGDKILMINNQPIKTWTDILSFIQQHPNDTARITLERNKKTIKLLIDIGYQRSIMGQKQGWIGIGPKITWPPGLLKKIQYSPTAALPRAYEQVKDLTYLNLLLFGKMITGKLSLKSLGGSITIFDSAGDALNSGWLAFLSFLAFLSIAIGIVNFLPIPGLDGGHLFLQTIEALIGRPIPERTLIILFRLGFAFLFVILIQALINDILRMS